MTTVILDTGLLAEATLSEGAGWIAQTQFSSDAAIDGGSPEFSEAFETAVKGVACFKLLDRFSQLAPRDRAHIDALAALRAGFVEHSLCSAHDVEWESVLANVLFLLQRGNEYVCSEDHVADVTTDVARLNSQLTAQQVAKVFAKTAQIVDARVSGLFKEFERAA